MSGLEALERVKKDEALAATPIIVISGHATVNDAVQAISWAPPTSSRSRSRASASW
jgi:CheY-like chemotaxis protein